MTFRKKFRVSREKRCRSAACRKRQSAHRPYNVRPRQKCCRPTDRQHLCPVQRTKQNGVSRRPLQSSERPQTLLLPRAGKTVHKFPTASLCTDLPIPPHKINARWYTRLTESPQTCRTKPKDSARLASFYAPGPEGRYRPDTCLRGEVAGVLRAVT